MQPLEKLGIFILVVVVAAIAYVYFRYIVAGEDLPPEDKDWKKTRDEEVYRKIDKYKNWLEETAAMSKALLADIDVSVHKMFKQLKNDTIFQWGFIVEFFKEIGRLINWNKWRIFYIAVLVILFGLFLHYVIGV